MNVYKFLKLTMLGVMLASFPACNGILDGLYDEKPEDNGPKLGFLKYDETTREGKIYVDATSYARWIYLDLHDREMVSDTIIKDQVPAEPEKWDIAVHRYDAKTNGGSAMETPYDDFNVLVQSGSIPDGEFVADQESKVTIDMSGMMDGNIIYSDSMLNKELSKWLDVNTSSMPPVYTLSHKVYVVKLKDNTYAALKLQNFMSESATKGFLTIEYIYPLDL